MAVPTSIISPKPRIWKNRWGWQCALLFFDGKICGWVGSGRTPRGAYDNWKART